MDSRLAFIFLCTLTILRMSSCLNCQMKSVCSSPAYQENTIIGSAGAPLTQNYSLPCPGSSSWSGVSYTTRWFYSPNSNASQPLEVHEDPKLTTSGYNLVFHNVTGAYEGIYSCQAQFNDGSTSPIVPAACLYIAGRAFFRTCPVSGNGMEDCETTTKLQGEVGGSVEFDARLEYRHGGLCGATQRVRILVLSKVDENGHADSLYTCNNFRNASAPCPANRSRVTVSFWGDSKFDIKLSFHDMMLSDSGHYRIKVDLYDIVAGRRMSIFKHFTLNIDEASPPTAALPTAALPIGALSYLDVECSRGLDPLLELIRKILFGVQNITFWEFLAGLWSAYCSVITSSNYP